MKFAPGMSPEAEPKWKPLEDKIGPGCADYMYVAGYQLEDGTVIHTYKHVDTRKYVNLSDDGREWAYTTNGYSEIQDPRRGEA